jgi:ferric-dicitrate binding protein FerR (iron transport regulator)
MMNETRLAYLFEAYFNKTATPIEHDELMDMLSKDENDGQVKILLSEAWQQFNINGQVFNDTQGEEMLANILQEATVKNAAPFISMQKRSLPWLRIAAAAAILLFAVAGAYLWLNPRQSQQQIAQSKAIFPDTVKAITPGGNRAVLTLSDGSGIVLDSIHQGTLATQGSAQIMKLNTATLAYNVGNVSNQEVVYNTLSTPRGGQYQLILPDGTRVWLNASSSIYFPTQFRGKERKVTVTGEAYFEVAKNVNMPFKVTVNDAVVEVLGTHFNIMAYNDEGSMNTTLLEGSVKISKGTLHRILVPGQQSRINKVGGIKVVEADIDQVMAWKNGWFQFNEDNIENVMRQISRWYDVEVVYEGKIPTGHFSGMVSMKNDISQVLTIMQAGGVQFKIEGRKLTVLS